ncbi:MAG: DIP1984 family protein [Clostridia bacterium]|nr:DIP1984 family protein [Clostridia bacterium]
MKLAEALNLRADVKKYISQLAERLALNSKVQEGEKPSEDPYKLLQELDSATAELEALIKRINRTNCATVYNGETITDMLARKDALSLKNSILRTFLSNASSKTDRYSLKEIRLMSTVDVETLRKTADQAAKALRQLDTQIQMLNWSTDLLDA